MPSPIEPVRPLSWVEARPHGHVSLLDQTLLPAEERRIEVSDVPTMVDAIRRLAVRGAPAIGLAAAYGVLLGVQRHGSEPPEAVRRAAHAAADELAGARPTAVNLFAMLDRMRAVADESAAAGADGAAVVGALRAEAEAIAGEIDDECRRMGEHGAALVREGAGILTHCNAGALATGGIGTALAPIYVAARAGLRPRVFADETRPLLQGARLTAWELARAGVDVTVIADGAAASVLRSGRVDMVFVGADRIARNGDVCNKIGTYGVAVLAHRHGVPFYVVAPLSTFDPAARSGDDIPIEERSDLEVRRAGDSSALTPEAAGAYNPAFDVTPAELVTAIVTELGVLHRPDEASVGELLRRGGRTPLPA